VDKPSHHWSKTPSFARECNLTNPVSNSLDVRRLTSMRGGCKFEGILDALRLCVNILRYSRINRVVKIKIERGKHEH